MWRPWLVGLVFSWWVVKRGKGWDWWRQAGGKQGCDKATPAGEVEGIGKKFEKVWAGDR